MSDEVVPLGAVVLDPFLTVSESNQREHWSVKHRRAKAQRSTTFLLLRGLLGASGVWRLPLTVTLTRLAPRALDSGNLEAALKAIQDGCADYLAGQYLEGEDRQAGLTWRYAQRRGNANQYAVEILIEDGENV